MRTLQRARDRRIILLDAPRGFVHPAFAYTRSQQLFVRQSDGSLATIAAQSPIRQHHATLGWYYRTNQGYSQLCLRNQALTNASWTRTGLNVPAQSAAGPDGATSSWTFTENSTTGAHKLEQSISFTSGTTYTFLVIGAARASARQFTLVLPAAAFGTDAIATVNFADGTSVKNGTALSVTSEALSASHWIFTVQATATVTTAGTIIAALSRTATAAVDSYAGDGASGCNVWGFNVTDTGYPAPFVNSAGTTQNVGGHTWSSTLANMNLNLPADYTLGCEYFAEPAAGTLPTRVAMQVDNGTANERAGMRYNGTASAVRSISVTGGVLTTVDSYTIAEGLAIKHALGVRPGLHQSAANATLGAGSTITVPAGLTTLRLGGDSGSNQLNGGMFRAWLLPSVAMGSKPLLDYSR